MNKLIRITTAPIALKNLLAGQMKYISENCFDVLMISADGKEREALIRDEHCPHIIVNLTRQITPWQDLKSLLKLIKILQKERPIIVHTHTPKAGLIGMLAAKICSVPLRIHTVAGLPLQTAKGIKRKILFLTEKVTGWAANSILPNSNSLRDYALENKLFNPAKVDLIGLGSSNGIDTKRFNSSSLKIEKIENTKKLIAYNDDTFYFLFIGRLVIDKGICELVNAFEKLNKSYHNIELIILGEFENLRLEESIDKKYIDKIENNKSIKLMGWQTEVEYFLEICDTLVHPSYREGFPNVLLQAGAMECPIICSDIIGNIDIVDDNKTGLYFANMDIDDLFRKMEFAVNNKQQLQLYAKNMHVKVISYFDRDFIHSKILEFYNKKINDLKSKKYFYRHKKNLI
jgi:glycosyltransferase involved in cell wall biosynthesis